VQIALLSMNDKTSAYAKKITDTLKEKNARVFLDDRNESLNKKIREAELQKIPYLLVVGAREKKDKTVSVRERGKGDLGAMPLSAFYEIIQRSMLRQH